MNGESKNWIDQVSELGASAKHLFLFLQSHLGSIGACLIVLTILAGFLWWKWDELKKRPGVGWLVSNFRPPARFAMIRPLKADPQVWDVSPNEPNTVVKKDPFGFATNPVFDIVVANNAGKALLLRRVGIRLLNRRPETGAIGGLAERLDVQAELKVTCPERWKTQFDDFGELDSTVWAELERPYHLEDNDARFTCTLELGNFCDVHSASTSEIRFLADTDLGVSESTSFWLRQ
jgi:hypothetical protein